jgi:hypothetical protein
MGKETSGFASMDPDRRRAVASQGGKTAQEKGTGHRWVAGREAAQQGGRKGGLSSKGKPRKAR